MHKPFSQAGMSEEKASFELSFFIGLAFCQGTYPENYRLNIGLQELWHEMYYNSKRENCQQSEQNIK